MIVARFTLSEAITVISNYHQCESVALPRLRLHLTVKLVVKIWELSGIARGRRFFLAKFGKDCFKSNGGETYYFAFKWIKW